MRNIFAKTSLLPVLAVVVLAASSHFLRAQTPSSVNISRARVEMVRILFPFDNANLNPGYLSNPQAIASLDAALEAASKSDKVSVSLVSYSSPEGNFFYNLDLSRRRAKAVSDYIKKFSPSVAGTVISESISECWDEFRSAVVSDSRISADVKDSMLKVIDSDSDPDEKEAALKSISAYKHFYNNYFRQFRFVEIRFVGLPDQTASKSSVDSGVLGAKDVASDGTVASGDEKTSQAAAVTTAAGQSAGTSAAAAGQAAAGDKAAAAAAGKTGTASEKTSGAAATGARTASVNDTQSGAIASDAPRALFRKGSDEFTLSWGKNAAAIAYVDSLLKDYPDGEIPEIVIVAGGSIDGPESVNEALGKRRAESLRDQILAVMPELESKIVVKTIGEDWDSLRKAVAGDRVLSDDSRAKMLDIIDSSLEADEKEARLKEVPGYEYLYESVFPSLRFARIANSRNLAGKTSTAGDKAGAVAGTTTGTTTTGDQAGKTSTTGDKNGAAAGTTTGTTTTGDQTGKTSTTGTTTTGDQTGATRTVASHAPKALFTKGSDEFFETRGENAAAIAYVDSLLQDYPEGEIPEIVIVAGGSIDGPESVNEALGKRRAESLKNQILAARPELEGKLRVETIGEDWDGFREAIVEDPVLSDDSRSRILEIIDSPLKADEKEARLKKLKDYDYLYESVFPRQRYAKIANARTVRPKAPKAPVVEIEMDETPDTLAHVNDTLDVVDFVQVVDSLVRVDDSAKFSDDTLSADLMKHPIIVRPIIAVSTNALYDAVITPNFALEAPLGHKFSVRAEYTFPWWLTKGNDRAWQMLKWDVGARQWLSKHDKKDPMDILTGHFIGIDLSAGYYDIEPHHKGHQGEFQLAGLEYGYAWDLGGNWRLDAAVGAGWMGTHYRYYEADSRDEHLIYRHHGKLNWFGPTKAEVSFKYIFTTKERRNGR